MSVEIIDNFKFRGTRPNFDRDSVDKISDLLNANPNHYDDGHIVYCKENGKHYVFQLSDVKDEVTGYFSLLKASSENDTATGDTDIWVGDDAPSTNDQIWLDTSTEDSGISVDELLSMQNAIHALQQQVKILMTMKTSGVVAGSVEDSSRRAIMANAEPQVPDAIKDEEWVQELEGNETPEVGGDESMDELQPEYSDSSEPTVTHIAIKTGTLNQIQNHMQDYVNGELLWCTDKKKLYIYHNGIIMSISGSGSDSGDSGDNNNGTNMDKTEIIQIVSEQLQSVESIGFIPVGSEEAKYTVKVNEEGRLVCYDNSLDLNAATPTSNYYFSDSTNMSGLLVNSFYLGGLTNDEHSYQPCSHNFVELSNVWVDGDGKQKDINLNGFYLFYMDNGQWQKLKLWGTIPAGGTFLIRGAQCSVMEANTTVLKIRDYDMQWLVDEPAGTDAEGNFIYNRVPIKFSQDTAAFYLAWGNADGKFYNLNEDIAVDTPSSTSCPIDIANNNCARGFVDLTSYNHAIMKEKATYTLPVGRNASEVIFRRWYPLDMVTQSNPDDGVEAHSTLKYMTSTYLNSSNIGECSDITEFTPKCSWEGKTIANTRSKFEEDRPSVLTNTFGIQGSDNGNGASRGFCWVSVGYYDEYLYLRKQGTSDWMQFESIREDKEMVSNYSIKYSDILKYYPQYYVRNRWETSYGQAVTTHKVILQGIPAGKYEYKVVRKGDSSYAHNLDATPRKFRVFADSEVKDFTFVQTTDQQGATWEEYEVWNLSARVMKREIDDPDGNIPSDYAFIVNTGDICYNGTRSNEWIDYFRGYEPLNDREEMLTVGNNDLIPPYMRDLGNGKESPWKINPEVIDYFYAVEMDPRNPAVFTGDSDDTPGEKVSFRIPGLYSFNFGEYHFMNVLSEMRTISNKTNVSASGSTSEKAMKQSTVNMIFGVKDVLRKNADGTTNPGASAIYDVEEEWMIKDLMVWKGINIPSNFDRNTARYNEGLVDSCGKCIILTHEMPFNIISQASYNNYEKNTQAPRETAKAYLNRYHNYEYQRLWKLWGILMVMGGHKHTCALTRAVYDAPLTYNPITKHINDRGPATGYTLYSDDILNDVVKTVDAAGNESWDTSGKFSSKASFQPFVQLTVEDFNNMWDGESFKDHCNEVYNNSTSKVTFTYVNSNSLNATAITKELNPDEFINDGIHTHPRMRIEIVDSITAPSYIMCQSTGFKNKSNSDLAAPTPIPWERFYVKGDNIKEQCYPFYTVYKVETDAAGKPKYTVKMYQIKGMYDAGGASGSPAGYWNLAKIYNKYDTLEANRDYYTIGVDGAEPACVTNLYNKIGDSVEGTIIK